MLGIYTVGVAWSLCRRLLLDRVNVNVHSYGFVNYYTMRPVKCVRDLDVHLDSELTMKTHISKLVSSRYHQLRRIRQVRRLVGQDVAQQHWFQHSFYRDSTTASSVPFIGTVRLVM